jgi:transposase
MNKWVMLISFDMEVSMKAYSMEFRRAVAAAYEQCGSSIEVAEQFQCSESWVRRLMQRYRASDSLEPLPPVQPDNNRLDEQDLEQLRRLIEQKPDMTLGELAIALDNKVSIPTVHRAVRKLDLRLKKNASCRRAGPGGRATGPRQVV